MTPRGWCPGVHEPMASGDGMLVRVKPPGGRLPGAALGAIADAATRHGNGVIELTSRGNLQIRGMTAASAPRFAAAMIDVGLADADPVREGRRNVITVPPADASRVAAIETLLADIDGLAAKFCIAAGPADADVMVLGDTIWAEGQSYPFALKTIRALAEGAVGRRLKPTPAPPYSPPGLLLGLPFGQTDAATLRRLATLTEEACTTPWRALHIPLPADLSPYAAAGFITDLDDPRRHIAACPGAPSCASGAAPARADAARLAAMGIGGVHVSGCKKGCAHPRAGRTLVGRAGRYDVVLDGRAGDAPDFTGLTLEQTITHLARL